MPDPRDNVRILWRKNNLTNLPGGILDAQLVPLNLFNDNTYRNPPLGAHSIPGVPLLGFPPLMLLLVVGANPMVGIGIVLDVPASDPLHGVALFHVTYIPAARFSGPAFIGVLELKPGDYSARFASLMGRAPNNADTCVFQFGRPNQQTIAMEETNSYTFPAQAFRDLELPQLNPRYEAIPSMSVGGELLGRTIIRNTPEFDITLRNIPQAEVRSDLFYNFILWSAIKPFYIQWRPHTYPDDIHYVWLKEPMQIRNAGPGDMVEVRMKLNVYNP